MDPDVRLPQVPLRQRAETLEAFNTLPSHIFPASAQVNASGELELGGVLISDLVASYGTPVFVMDEEDFRSRCCRLAVAFGGGHRVHYASKAFLSLTVARWVAEEGLSIDVASQGELEIALAADFPAERITVHGNNKSFGFLQRAVRAGVELIVIDSVEEIGRLAQVAKEFGVTQDALVRVKPGVHVDTHEFIATSHEDQKFGFSLASGSAERACVAAMNTPGIRLRGLHCHVGSQVFDADGFGLAADRLLGLWARLLDGLPEESERASALNILDLGGGYGIAYTSDQEPLDVETVASDLRRRVRQAAQDRGLKAPVLNVEPGRAIAGPSMVTLYTVGTVKNVHTSDDTVRRYISVDGGMSDNIRPALYQAEYDCRLANRWATGELVPTRVVGSHCESGDILINNALLPDDIVAGDILAIPATGAYCYMMASRYNMLMRPPVVVVGGGESRVMIRRETIGDVLALENFPR